MRTGRKLGKQSVNLALTVAQVVAPVFVLAGFGFGWVRLGFDYPVAFVTRLAMTLAVPALVFTALMKAQIEPAAMADIALAAGAAYLALIALVCGLGWAIGLDRRTFWGPLIFGNTGNVGLPLALFAFGEVGLAYGVVVFAFTSIGQFSLGIWLVSRGGAMVQVWREPMVLATALGAVFWSQGWHTPQWLTNALELTGQMAIPLMLLTLGVAVARLTPSGIGKAVLLSLAKIGLGASVAIAAAALFDLPHIPLAVLVLQMITPVAVTSYLLAEKYEADAAQVAGLVVVSTLICVVSFPIALSLLL